MVLRCLDMLFKRRAVTQAPCSTPEAVQRCKASELLLRFVCSVAIFLLVLSVLPKAPPFASVRWVAIGVAWLTGLVAQALYLANAIQKEEWSVEYKERYRWLGVLKAVYCYFFAHAVLSLLGVEGRVDVMSFVLGIFWWILYEVHMSAMQCIVTHAEMVYVTPLSAAVCHVHAISAWMQQAYRQWAGFAAAMLLAWLVSPSLFASFGAGCLAIVEMVLMTVLWMSGWIAFHENLHSRFDYGMDSGDASLQRACASIESTDPIIKMYGLGHVKWMVEVGVALGPKFSSLFMGDMGTQYWDICAKACCQELKSMSSIIIAVMGSVPDINVPSMGASNNAIYLTAKKIQNKYMLLRLCLGCLMGMLRAAAQPDHSGKPTYTGPSVEMVITAIFEGHSLVSRLAQSTATSVVTWLPYHEIWCLKLLQMEFEMAGMTAWRVHGKNLSDRIQKPYYVYEATLKKHVAHFVQNN